MIAFSFYHKLLSVHWFKTVRKIFYGVNAVKEKLGEAAKDLGGKKTLIITDSGLIKTPLVDYVRRILEESGLEVDVFSDVVPEPPLEIAEKAKDAVREGKYNLVVGLGGGSAMDVAKIAAVLADNLGNVEDYLAPPIPAHIEKHGVPKILIPTTAGTGAEVSDVSVFVKGNSKVVVYSDHLMADTAIIDPIMTLTLPPKATASSGMDALSHAIESFMSRDSSPISEILSLGAVKLIFESLRIAYYRGEDIEARANMSLAALIAGIAFANTGASAVLGHAIGLALGAKYNLPHGMSCAIILPYIVEFNAPSIPEKMRKLAEAIGLKCEKLNSKEIAEKVVSEIKNLMIDISIPTKISEIGADERDIPEIAEEAIKAQRLIRHNPRTVKKEDIEMILRKAF